MFNLLLGGALIAATSYFARTVNRRSTTVRTVFAVLIAGTLALLLRDSWYAWRHALSMGGSGYPYSMEFAANCIAGAMCVVALARRIWWLRDHRHTAWW